MEPKEEKDIPVGMETQHIEKSPPLEVDLGVSSETILVLNKKPSACDDDDDVPLILGEKPGKKKPSTFLKLICVMIFLISVIMVISSFLLSYERRASQERELYRVEARMGPHLIERPRLVETNQNLINMMWPPSSRDLFSEFDNFFDRSFNFYLDSLHHMRDNMISEFRSFHPPDDFIKIRFRPSEGFLGMKIIRGVEPQTPAPNERPSLCSSFEGVYCKVLLDTGNARLAVLSSLPQGITPLKENKPKEKSSWLLPLNTTTNAPKAAPTVIPVVHSEKAAVALENKIKIKPEVIPYYCPRLGNAPEMEETKGNYVLFPGKTRELTDYFMKAANNASENLDIAGSLFHMGAILDQMHPNQKLSTNIKAVIFPMRDMPEETLHQFYCLGIPLFVPLVDFDVIRASGKSAMRCNETDIMRDEIVHHAFYSNFPHVIHYSCFYELAEKLNEVNYGMVRLNMWKDNVEKNKIALEKMENLRKEAGSKQN